MNTLDAASRAVRATRSRPIAAGLTAALVAVLGFAAPASASSGSVYVTPSPPQPTTTPQLAVGQSGVPASVIVNDSSPTGAVATVGLVTVAMSCNTFYATGLCQDADTGVLRPSTTGTGRLGTACAGITFDISSISSTGGFTWAPDTYQFTPRTSYTVGGAPGSCRIDYTVDVLKLPTDVNSALPGAQSWQAGFGSSDGSGPATNGTLGPGCSSVGCGGDTAYTVNPAPPTDSTQTAVSCVPSSLAAGSTTTCTATVTDTASTPQGAPTGTVTLGSDGPGSFSNGGQCSLSATGDGAASCSVTYTPGSTPATPTRTDTISAAYGGDSQHGTSSGTTQVTVDSLPTTKDQCLNYGWQSFGVFRNQGDCVSYVEALPKSTAASRR
jgi:hypothetical protein